MIGLSFFDHEIKNELQNTVTVFANNNLLDMLSFVKDSFLEEDFFEIILPLHYIREHSSECMKRFYELQELIKSPVCRVRIKPLYEYILYQIIDTCIEIEDTYQDENNEPLFHFELPVELNKRIESEFDIETGIYITEQLKCVKKYIDFCFWDWDFVDNVEMIATCAIKYGKCFTDELLTIDANEYIDLMPVDLKDEYLKTNREKKERSFSPEEILFVAISNSILDLERRTPEVADRLETTLSNDINMGIRPLLALYNIISTREYQMGRALKALGETDFYFFTTSTKGNNKDIAILESKVIEKFPEQYKQLLGYLNQNFSFGLTLSINKTKPNADAKKIIIDCLRGELKNIDTEDFLFETNLVQYDCQHPLVAISEHKIPENPVKKMKVYHFMLNLYDKPRKNIAKKARET